MLERKLLNSVISSPPRRTREIYISR